MMFICKTIISAIIETKPTNKVDYEYIKDLYYYEPGGTSTKNLKHWMQIIGSKAPSFFDHGSPEVNQKIYNSTEAPFYNLDNLLKFTKPIFITTSDADPYCLLPDFRRMTHYFQNANLTVITLHNYNHLDYLWSRDAHYELYTPMLKFLIN